MPRAENPLKTYHEKRDFTRTPEPKGAAVRKKKAKGLAYVIQKHDATRLHFDFRLELDGYLMSWAVTRGPSLNPADKRLAVRTENHPLEYGDFEGVIPSGYGAGTVMLWDRGTWEPITDPYEGLEKGNFKFTLFGERLKGGFALIRMAKKRGEKQESWLLIKERDEHMDREFDPVAHWDDSVKSGRDFAALEKSDDTWTKEGGAGKKNKAPAKKKAAKKGKPAKRTLKFVKPQLASARDEPPSGDEWLHEIKFDGYRMIALIENGEARLITRNEIDWTDRYQSVADELGDLKVKDAIVDGELVALGEDGRSRFGALQDINSGSRGAHGGELAFYAFDLLRLDGKDLMKRPLFERKEALRKVIGKANGRIRFSDHVIGDGDKVLENATAMQLEGIISKKASAPYLSGGGTSWVKVKAISNDEFVVGGYRKSTIRGRPFASLLLGEYVDGEFQYRGRVGTGFDEKTLSDLGARMAPLKRAAMPFASAPAEAKRSVQWVEPKLVAQVAYTERTSDGYLRHPSFLGLREDKKAKDVVAPAKPAHSAAKKSRDQILGVKLTNPDRIFYPGEGITKEDVAEYYAKHADRVLAHLAGRPLSIVRCPDGLDGERFFQKHSNASTPKQIKNVMIREKEGKSPYLMIDTAEGLVAAAQIAALELHVWGVRSDNIERPERLVFDLDPDEDLEFSVIVDAAHELRSVLEAANLKSFAMITGGKGVHVIAPIDRRSDWDEAKTFSRSLAQALSKAAPDRYLAAASKAKRKGKIFIDWMRNERGSTAIAPYSTRARPGAPIATPVSWSELKHLDSAAQFTLANIDRRLAKADPWEGYFDVRQSITKASLAALTA